MKRNEQEFSNVDKANCLVWHQTESPLDWQMKMQLNYHKLYPKCKCCKKLESNKWLDGSELCFVCRHVFTFGSESADKNHEYYMEWIYTRYAHRVMAEAIYPPFTFNPKFLEIIKRKIMLVVRESNFENGTFDNSNSDFRKFSIKKLNLFKEELWAMRYNVYKAEGY